MEQHEQATVAKPDILTSIHELMASSEVKDSPAKLLFLQNIVDRMEAAKMRATIVFEKVCQVVGVTLGAGLSLGVTALFFPVVPPSISLSVGMISGGISVGAGIGYGGLIGRELGQVIGNRVANKIGIRAIETLATSQSR